MKELTDGYQTLITFAARGTVNFKEKSVTPPGIDGGGEIDTTTMHNVTWRTRNPKALISLTNVKTTVAYDPAVYGDIMDLVNVNNLITVTFPDSTTVSFWGWLNSFTPGDNTEGEQPTAEIEIIPSNTNSSGAEAPPSI